MAAERSDVSERVRGFYSVEPFPGNLNAYGPWQDQAPNLLRNLNIDPGSIKDATLLDAGCGTGEYSRSFANLGAKVTGVDITEEVLLRARALDKMAGVEGIEYHEGNLFELSKVVEGQSYDAVVSLGVLHHTSDPERAFHSVADRVNPGGLLIVGLYNPISRVHILAARHVIRFLSRGDTEKGVKIAASPVFRPLVRRSVGEENANQPQRIADLLVHPHEIPVTINNSLRWYESAGLEVVGSDPSVDIKDYSGLRLISGKVPKDIEWYAIQARWLRWLADYYVVAGRRLQ